jgi:ABC-type uncharacterized transport system permease subunit
MSSVESPPQPKRDRLLTRSHERRESVSLTMWYIVSIGVALLISAGLVAATGGSPSAVLSAMFDGSLRSPGAWGVTLTIMAPLVIVASGTIIATRAGLVNIGQEGQVLVGAMFGAYFATRLPGPGPLVLIASLIAAGVGGGLWAGIAAWLRVRRSVPEVLSTLLLVFIAFPLALLGLRHRSLLLDRDDTRINHVNSGDQIPEDTLLPEFHIFGNNIDSGILLALVLTLVLAWLLNRTLLGFRVRLLGLNPRAAQRFGVPSNRYLAGCLIASGAFAGVAGGVLLHGSASGDRFSGGMAGNFGWDGLLVALLARDKISRVIPMAFVFAMLRTGSSFLASTGVDRKMTDVVQASLVLALLLPSAIVSLQNRRRASAAPAGGSDG